MRTSCVHADDTNRRAHPAREGWETRKPTSAHARPSGLVLPSAAAHAGAALSHFKTTAARNLGQAILWAETRPSNLSRDSKGTGGVLQGPLGVLWGYCADAQGVLWGYSRGTHRGMNLHKRGFLISHHEREEAAEGLEVLLTPGRADGARNDIARRGMKWDRAKGHEMESHRRGIRNRRA